jgi:hypothetical protein
MDYRAGVRLGSPTSSALVTMATEAHCKVVEMKREPWGFGFDIHRSWDDSEEVVQWWWHFGFERQRHGHDIESEEVN